MIRTNWIDVFCFLPAICAIPANAQLKERQLIWEPPRFELPSQFPKPSSPKPIITSLKVAGISIQLEHTHLDAIGRALHATEGRRGDAGEALGWVCLYGGDEKGLWERWLMSGEIDGPAIGSFQWQRFPSDATFDHRCKSLDDSVHEVELAVDIRLGMTTSQVEAAIGKRTSNLHNTQLYSHEHSTNAEWSAVLSGQQRIYSLLQRRSICDACDLYHQLVRPIRQYTIRSNMDVPEEKTGKWEPTHFWCNLGLSRLPMFTHK